MLIAPAMTSGNEGSVDGGTDGVEGAGVSAVEVAGGLDVDVDAGLPVSPEGVGSATIPPQAIVKRRGSATKIEVRMPTVRAPGVPAPYGRISEEFRGMGSCQSVPWCVPRS
jgi:hypothetical protein